MAKKTQKIVSDCDRCGAKTPIICLDKEGLCEKCAYFMKQKRLQRNLDGVDKNNTIIMNINYEPLIAILLGILGGFLLLAIITSYFPQLKKMFPSEPTCPQGQEELYSKHFNGRSWNYEFIGCSKL